MLREGIIRPSNSPWRAQVLVTGGENRKKRMVIDYSQTINRFTELDAYPLPRIAAIVGKVAAHKDIYASGVRLGKPYVILVRRRVTLLKFAGQGNN